VLQKLSHLFCLPCSPNADVWILDFPFQNQYIFRCLKIGIIWDRGMAEVVEHWLSNCQTLSPNPTTIKKKKKEKV
jgi:hypothetical protein